MRKARSTPKSPQQAVIKVFEAYEKKIQASRNAPLSYEWSDQEVAEIMKSLADVSALPKG
jgi:hypothetical protein